MSKIISVNAGSSSLKFQLFNMPEESVICSGIFERIGQDVGSFSIKVNGNKYEEELPIPSHEVAVKLLLDALVKYDCVASLDEIKGAGHRVVQGGAYYSESTIVDDEVAEVVLKCADLAPLHNKANLSGYEAFRKALPSIGNVFVFDTAFHQTMEPGTYMYGTPYSWYTDYQVRKYGMHGTSHYFVSKRLAELVKGTTENTKLISCHLGNGASITAVKNGECINTSMGFTPLAGIMMGTRSGDIDPALIPYMMKKLNKTADEIENILNKESGMLGISGISSDARDIENAIKEGNTRAELTHDIYVNRIVNVVGGYIAQMGGVDAIAFTAGVGENDSVIREKVMKGLSEAFGIVGDYELNAKVRGKEVCLTKPESKVAVWIVPTNEELVIARDTVRLLGL